MLTDEKALDIAKEELHSAIYLSECGGNAGIRKINSDKADWLSVLIYNAEQYNEVRKMAHKYEMTISAFIRWLIDKQRKEDETNG